MKSGLLFTLVVALLAIPQAASAQESVCANDAYADATDLGVVSGTSTAVIADNTCATSETGETADGEVHSLWYSFAPAVTGTMTISTCSVSTEFDTWIGVYDDAPDVASAALVASNNDPVGPADDRCSLPGGLAQLTVPVTAATTYRVQVDGAAAATGLFELRLQQVDCQGTPATHVGSAGADVWAGVPADAVVVSLGDNDSISTTGGTNLICAGEGNDVVVGSAGRDTVLGGPGDDDIRTAGGADTIIGDSGDDVLRGGSQPDTILAGPGQDTVIAGGGNDFVSGGPDNDSLNGGAGADNVSGDGGEDIVRGQGDRDILVGGPGDDLLRSHAGNDDLFGGGGDDTLLASGGDDSLLGGNDDDTLWAGTGADDLNGGNGDDFCHGGSDTATDTDANCETRLKLP